MKKTLYKIGIAVVGLVITTAVVAGASYAYNGFGEKGQMKMLGVVELDDYDSWTEQMKERGIDESLITEENFSKMKEAQDLMESGDKEAAMEIKEELSELGFGKGQKGLKLSEEEREAIDVAIESGDYNAWKEAVGEDRAAEVTEDEFPRLQEAHRLMLEGKEKINAAKEIHEEIGLKGFGSGGMHRVKAQE